MGIPDGNDEVREAPVLRVSQASWEAVDFILPNIACSEGPDAPFAKDRLMNLRRKDGHISVRGNNLTIVKNGVREHRLISEDEAKKLMVEEFGLILE